MDQAGAKATDGAASARGWEAPPGTKSATSSVKPPLYSRPMRLPPGPPPAASLLHQHRRSPPPPRARRKTESPTAASTAVLARIRSPAAREPQQPRLFTTTSSCSSCRALPRPGQQKPAGETDRASLVGRGRAGIAGEAASAAAGEGGRPAGRRMRRGSRGQRWRSGAREGGAGEGRRSDLWGRLVIFGRRCLSLASPRHASPCPPSLAGSLPRRGVQWVHSLVCS
jgi:hypothetical protein